MGNITIQEKFVTDRVLEVFDNLKATGRVKNKTAFSASIGMPREYMTLFEKHERPLPPHYINVICDIYNVNRDFFEKEGARMFIDGANFSPLSDKSNISGNVHKNKQTNSFSLNDNNSNNTSSNDVVLEHYKQRIADLEADKAELKEENRELKKKVAELYDKLLK